MSNLNTQAAWEYHNSTKHTWRSVHSGGHSMDWNNQPRPFKLYPGLEGQRLPSDLAPSGVSALDVLLGRTAPAPSGPQLPSLQQIAALLYFSAGITKRGVVGGGGQMYFRAAACTGALYHIELYLVCGDLPDLPAGVYHFGPHDFSLRPLRQGDFRGVLAEASGGEPAVAHAPAVIVTTSVFWRNAWKYQARAYRHSYWDSGTILANLLAAGAASQVPLQIVTAFADAPVNQLLGLDTASEAALHLVSVGRTPEQPSPPAATMPPLALEIAPYSRREVDYPAMRAMHQASSLTEPAEARDLRGSLPVLTTPALEGAVTPLAKLLEGELPRDTIEQVIQRRGSSRSFRRDGIGLPQLAAILSATGGRLPADFLSTGLKASLGKPGDTLVQMYLIANAVEDGLATGSYAYHPDTQSLELLQAGDFRERAGYLGLEQELPADASVNLYFLTDLTAVLARYGNRGYRMAQTEAAIRGGWAYLAAYAQRLGASGLTFYDDEVTQFFSPHAAGRSVMFLVALGRPQRRPRLES
ncbi:MAG: SagB/ThcOx family dehydrogenase [Dehalococcoidia bacterium]|nr:SagB/ThcOx family dehydrogenase [Dehalococcoidia bacterium]